MINLKPVILLLFIFCCSVASAQTNTGDAFIQKATTAAAALQPTEKVYLHLDKPYYAAGDDIWFKAYLTTGEEHKLSVMSGLLTVDLLNEKGALLRSINIYIKYGLGAGDFHLPNNAAAGKYQVRAYTNYMRNWGSEYFFNKPIYVTGVTNSDKPSGKSTAKEVQSTQPAARGNLSASADVQFMPEGGSFINGVNSRIAFKATGADGNGLAVKGTVVDNAGNEVIQFASRHLGMGSFDLSPVAGTSYTAKLIFSDGSQALVKLPYAVNSGYALTVNNLKNNPQIIYQVAYNKQAVNDSTLILIAQYNGHVSYVAKLKLKGSEVTAKIMKDKLPTGISQLTLFRENGEPVAERLVFVDNHDQLSITLTNADKVNRTHQLSTIKLNATDGENKAYGSFSAAVIDDTKAPDDNLSAEENIMSYLLLTSDLKGKIEAPGSYFKSDTPAANLDLLMMTQGYRHFEWKKILNSQQAPLAYQPQRGITVSGHLLSPSGKPLVNANVTIFVKKPFILHDTVTNAQGGFAFNNMAFADSVNILLTGKTKNGRDNMQIKVDEVYNSAVDGFVRIDYEKSGAATAFQADTVPAVYRQLANEKFKKYPAIINGEVMLKEVKVNAASAKPKVEESSANLNGAGHADKVLTGKDLEKFGGGDLCFVLGSGVVGGITVSDGKLINTQAHMGKGSSEVLTVLDGSYYNGDLCTLNVSDVESVEILKNVAYTAIYGSRGANGVAIITTKRGNGISESVDNATRLSIQGFYKAKEFYSPKYDDSKVNIQLADLRSTIYWNPDVLTDKEGNASFSYDNAGQKGIYRVIVQGVDVNGKLGYQVLKYKVE